MGSPLPRGPPCCSRSMKATSQTVSPTQQFLSSGRVCSSSHLPRRLTVSAFLFNPSANGSARTKESISNRLSELRIRSEEEDRAFLNQRSDRADDSEGEEDDRRPDGGVGPCGRGSLGPWPLDSTDEEGGDAEGGAQSVLLAGAAAGAAVTPRSLRYLVSDPKPEIKLLHRFKPGQGPDNEFWRSFVDKCRLAWGVFFPPAPHRRPTGVARWAGNIGRLLTPGPSTGLAGSDGSAVNGLSAKQVVLSRLQMVLIADRCGVSPEQLLEMKAQTLTALAEYMGKDLKEDVSQLEVQVSALKPNGERLTMTIGFADMLGDEQLRDPLQYHYQFEDDDDYFMPDEENGRVAEIAEAPVAGLQAARVAAKPITSPSGSPTKAKGDESSASS